MFHTRSDTEVIVHAWEAWGERCVDRFRGMFAFALYDRNRETLFMARDRLGVKPLYYAVLPDGTLLFGSELKSLLVHPGARARRSIRCAVEEYFALGYVAEPRTIFTSTKKLPPAHTLTVRRGQPVPEPVEYWDVRFTLASPITLEEACEELNRRLEESIRLRMISEVPLGAFLSGGVDSSAVVATMARISSEPGQHLLDLVRRSGVRRDALRAAGGGPLQDAPLRGPRGERRLRPRRPARRHLRRAVRRQLGDPDVPGLPAGAQARHGGALRRRRRRELRRLPPLPHAPDGGAHALGAAARRAPAGLRPARPRVPQGRLGAARVPRQDHVRVAGAHQRRGLPAQRLDHPRADAQPSCSRRRSARRLGGYRVNEVFERHAARAGTDDALALVQYLDLKTYLVGDINTKVDRASMAHSLEVREPLMDHPLVEWLATLPNSLKVQGQEGKYVLKKAMEPHLPHEIMYRPEDGLCGAAGALVPRAAQAAGARRRARLDAGRDRHLRPQGAAAPRRRAPGRAPRLQRAAVDDADVRVVPAQRHGRRRSASGARGGMTLADPARPRSLDPAAQRLHVPDAGDPEGAARARLGDVAPHVAKHYGATADEEEVDGLPFLPHASARPAAGAPPRCWTSGRSSTIRERRLDEVIAQTRPDILHAHSPCLNGIAAMRVGRRLGLPVVYEMRAFWEDAAVDHGTTTEGSLRYRLSRALETWTLRRADAVTTICEGLRADILGRGIAGRSSHRDPECRGPRGVPADP